MSGPTVEIIFAEFGRTVPLEREDNVRRFFPEASITQICGAVLPKGWNEKHPRLAWRLNDYWKVRALLESKADIAIAFDADMRILRDDVRAIIPLAQAFGLCIPANPRHLVRFDTLVGADSDGKLDDTNGNGYALNCTPIAFSKNQPISNGARAAVRRYLELMEANPVRGPLAWWRAFYQTGFSPCLLPPEWCVCEADLGMVNHSNAIILHEGHDAVRRAYADR